MKKLLLLLALSIPALAETPYQYFAETGVAYDWIGRTPASVTGFGLRIANSNAFSVTSVSTSVIAGNTVASLSTGFEYHVASVQDWEFIGLGNAGILTDGNVTLGNFSGGFAVSYDLGKLITRGRFSLPAVVEFAICTITATQVKPIYLLKFRKTF